MTALVVREARDRDADEILAVHKSSVHRVACKDYAQDILDEWSPPIDTSRTKSFLENLDKE